MSCEQYSDLYELYALGLAEGEERTAFEAHLAGGCDDCSAQLERAFLLNEAILKSAAPVIPDPRLRRRVLAAFDAPQKPRVVWPWAAVLAAAAAVILFLSIQLNTERNARQSDGVELARLREIAQILESPETKQVQFGPGEPQTPRGSLLIHPRSGIILIANGLPPAPAGSTYESWIVPKQGPPRPIAPFTATGGHAVTFLPGPVDVNDLKAVAVSLEPANQPVRTPTKLVFAAPTG